MKTDVMRAKFIGDDMNDPGTVHLGVVKGGTYLLRLMHPNWFQRLLGEKGVVAIVRVCGKKKSVIYGSIRAFDNNWKLQESI